MSEGTMRKTRWGLALSCFLLLVLVRKMLSLGENFLIFVLIIYTFLCDTAVKSLVIKGRKV